MKKKIGILGSTGSIGKNTAKIIYNNKKDFEVIFLSTNKNVIQLYHQSIKLKPKAVIIFNNEKFVKYKERFIKKKIKVFNSFKNLKKSILNKKIDYIMCAISGLDGLDSTINCINNTRNIAIANKESIICSLNIIEKKITKDKIYITASGGPFLNYKFNKLKYVTPKEAINHPNWSMGKKISIDSATLMNKVFEIIEAQRIFNIDIKKFQILIHPKSYVHSIVKFINGQIKIFAHDPDMKVPIFNSIYQNQIKKFNTKKININLLNNLNFTNVNLKKFPSINLLKNIKNKSTLFETVLISANDELVDLFIKNKIKFLDITTQLHKILKIKKFSRLINQKPRHIKEILTLSKEVRLKTRNLCIR